MLAQKYKEEIIPDLQKKTGEKNIFTLPRLEKVVINMRVSEGKENRQLIEDAAEELKAISGQKPRVCSAKKSVAGFKLKKGDPIGLKVTLRNKKMYDFLERLFSLVLPSLRDFRGISYKQFDQKGNFNIGLREQTVFPELNIDRVKNIRGLQVTIVTKNTNVANSKLLLESLGLPFKKEEG